MNNEQAWLFEHDDGRHRVAFGEGPPAFTQGDPAWHRVGPVEIDSAPPQQVVHVGLTIAGNGAAELGALMREQRASRLGVYPDGNPNASTIAASPSGRPSRYID